MNEQPAVGTHLSTRGRLALVPERAAAMGAEAIQIFVGNPRGWATPSGDPAADAAFRAGVAEHGITVLPPDINISYWDNTLEPLPFAANLKKDENHAGEGESLRTVAMEVAPELRRPPPRDAKPEGPG